MLQANFFVLLLVSLCISEVSTNDYWRPAHNMTQERMLHQSTFVNGMNVVVISSGCLTAIDVFYVSNGSIIQHGDRPTPGCSDSADLLPNGLVFITGDVDVIDGDSGCVADLYDPRSGNIKRTSQMSVCRCRHTSSVIQADNSTKILLAGGFDGEPMASGDVFDFKSKSFYPVNNSMIYPREFHTATVLPNEHVIIAGGWRHDDDFLDDLILYNSRLNRFISLSAHLSVKRVFHTATYLPSIESILFVSGSTFDLFDVPTLTLAANGTTLQPRASHTATLLLDGRVLITGGNENYGLASCEIYDPIANKFMQAANMSTGRYWHTATLIPTTGEVLVCGGRNLQGLFNSCEIYTP